MARSKIKEGRIDYKQRERELIKSKIKEGRKDYRQNERNIERKTSKNKGKTDKHE